MSGPTRSIDSTDDGGNVYVSFVSAEGTETQVVQTNFPAQTLSVVVLVQNQRGQLQIDVLDETGSVVTTVQGTAQERGSTGTVRTDASGRFRYRVRATGAQRGSYSILYQPSGG